MQDSMVERLKSILNEISNGNNLNESITLVGATKTIDVDTINLAIENGLKVVAENKVQEFREKTDKIVGADQHFIGHLQTNKIKYLVGKVSLIHSVDSFRLAKEISDYAIKKDLVQDVLIEINIGNQLTKSGYEYSSAMTEIEHLKNLKGIRILGLMTMLPHIDDREYLKKLCLQMRELYDKMIKVGYNFSYLSMGMSNDYQIAIENGSNMIRLGSSIFGKRNYEVK